MCFLWYIRNVQMWPHALPWKLVLQTAVSRREIRETFGDSRELVE